MSQLWELSGHLEAKAEALEKRLKARAVLPLSALLPYPHQPRKRLEGLEDLAASLREKGVLQPLLVRPLGDGKYEIVAGERRYRAAGMAGLEEVPVVVLDLTPEEARAVALIENLKREDLNPTLPSRTLVQRTLARWKGELEKAPSCPWKGGRCVGKRS